MHLWHHPGMENEEATDEGTCGPAAIPRGNNSPNEAVKPEDKTLLVRTVLQCKF